MTLGSFCSKKIEAFVLRNEAYVIKTWKFQVAEIPRKSSVPKTPEVSQTKPLHAVRCSIYHVDLVNLLIVLNVDCLENGELPDSSLCHDA